MYETHGTVVGTVITTPATRSGSAGEEFLAFRMASTVRRRDYTTGEWRDGSTLYLTVTCRRRLMSGVVQSLAKGDPVIVTGELRTNEYTTRDGVARTDLELSATAVGPDLARCTVVLDREPRTVAPVEAMETSSTESASTDSVSTEQAAAETLVA